MLTRHAALTANEFHYTGNGPCTRTVGPKGGVTESIVRVRRNGMTQTWKTRPTEYSVPVKYGIRSRDQFRITSADAEHYHAADDCPLRSGDPVVLVAPEMESFRTIVADIERNSDDDGYAF